MKENKKIKINKQFKEKGITLIALVTTIVILLILAGVTISQITRNGGLFSKTKKEVDKYGNAGDYEEKGLQQLSRYMLDFSIVGDNNISEGEKALVKITGMQIDTISTNSIKVTVIIEGTASKIEYSIDNGESWKTGESSTPNEYTFENLKAGSYFFRVKVYDVNSKIIEAISKIITIGEITTADVGNVLNGKTFWRNGEVKNGSMVDNGAVNPEALVAGTSYKIPAGYHNGNGTVTAKDLKSQTQGTATATQILKSQIAWVNGSKIIGTMENRGEVKPGALSAGDSYIIPEGYHNGKGKVTTKTLREQTPGDATAEDIAEGKEAWVDGSKIIGKMENSIKTIVLKVRLTERGGGDYGFYIPSSCFNTIKITLDSHGGSRNWGTKRGNNDSYKWYLPVDGESYTFDKNDGDLYINTTTATGYLYDYNFTIEINT